MNQIKTYRYKLNPTPTQQQQLSQWIGSCRYVYNLGLAYKKTLWEQYKISITKNNLQKELACIAKETPWIGLVHSQTLQDVTDRLYKAYEGFFKHGKGFPRFAQKGQYTSFNFKQGVKVGSTHIQLPKLGCIHYFNSQVCPASIKRATVSQLADGWYVFLYVEVDIAPLPVNTNQIGIDVGVKSLLTTSSGEIIANPKHLYKAERKLKRLQRSVTRKKKGSINRLKAVQGVARQYQKVTNARKDFQHKLTSRLIRENQTIVVEKLQVKNMIANHSLAKSISDAGWYQLIHMLNYKARWYGRELIRVNAAYTSKSCSTGGYIYKEMTLKVRDWKCPNCSCVHDRDINAAINILKRAINS